MSKLKQLLFSLNETDRRVIEEKLKEKYQQIDQLKQQLKDKDFIIKNLNHSLSVAPNANAGQRARIDELTKIVKEKDKEINSLIADYEKRISQEQELMSNMEHRLVEKQNKIEEISKEFVQVVHKVYDWRVLCAEKDKEIEKLKQQYTILENENGKLTTELIMDRYKKAQKEVSFGKQLAIQKLEKLKASADKWFEFWENSKYEGNIYDKLDVSNAYLQMSSEIDQQIKKLKGEKDVED